MPTKIETETQILRLISKSPLQVSCDFMRVSTHESTHVSQDHLVKFYDIFDAFRDKNYDGLIITGAPVEHLDYADVDYWDEFCEIVDWSQEHVFSTMYALLGGAGRPLAPLRHPQAPAGRQALRRLQAASLRRVQLPHHGFDEVHYMPHSVTPQSTPPSWQTTRSSACFPRALRAARRFSPRATSTRST